MGLTTATATAAAVPQLTVSTVPPLLVAAQLHDVLMGLFVCRTLTHSSFGQPAGIV